MNTDVEPPKPSAPHPGQAAARAPQHRGKWRWLLVIAVLLAAGFAWHRWSATSTTATSAHKFGGTNQTVRVATARAGDMPVVFDALGTVTPLANVTVRTQISGQLMSLGFREGQMVAKGDFLAQVDPRPYQVALEQDEGQLARDRALLAQARRNFARYQILNRQDSIARQQVDDQQSLVQQYEAAVQTDQGLVDSARLNLTYCHIIAPVAGRVGLRQVDPGNYVQTSDTNGIVVITQMQPTTVLFTLPEDDLPALLAAQQAGESLAVDAYDRGNTELLGHGTLAALDNQVDTTTGTVKLKALFANDDLALFPNQFVNVRLTVRVIHDAILIPAAAILTGAPGSYVYKLDADDTVAVQTVTPGPADGETASVTKGLAAGDVVVIDGTDRLKDGATVTVATTAPGAPSAPGGAAPAHKHHRHKPKAATDQPPQE